MRCSASGSSPPRASSTRATRRARATSRPSGTCSHDTSTEEVWSRALSCRASRGETSTMLHPACPARPVRPLRCTKASRSPGSPTWMTWEIPATSSPRAATSVATSTGERPDRRDSSASFRSRWVMSPWSAEAPKPASRRKAAVAEVSSRVRQNTNARGGCSASNTFTSPSRARPVGTRHPRWEMSSWRATSSTREMRRGSSKKRRARSSTSGGMVAEKSQVRRSSGQLSKMASSSSRKPRSSMWSPSSRTTVCTPSRRNDPRRR
ncbi:MAG: hypothetical protein BWY88_00953 [Synergistetes bacterium ADurb.Bin520]|nr:MAG: hypothetical protein BWY88_00953 [Synergistetes bacterium ADurb.Bin520]